MKQVIETRRAKAAACWNLHNEVVLIGAGSPIGIPGGLDQTFEYRVHPEYRWLTEEQRPGSVLAYDPQSGWTRFAPAVTEAERIWDGVTLEPEGPYLDELGAWLQARSKMDQLHLGAGGSGSERESELRAQLTHARRSKDELEIAKMAQATKATLSGHQEATRFIRPGVTERQIQIEIEAAFCRGGATRPGYSSIVGTGSNSAVFHFTPGSRIVKENDVVLVDAGAEVDGYVIDVTRTYSANGKFTSQQQAIYDIVLNAEERAVNRCRTGMEWLHVHLTAALDMAQGLVDLGILKGTATSAVESEAMAMFFPHGIGHMVGLGVRDASGTLPGRTGDARAAGVRVRCDFPLAEGYLMTVEPGIYFIPALLNDPERRRRFVDHVDWNLVDEYMGMGGIRIEDNVLVTVGNPVNLTAEIPK